jgi:hypothetical protein
VSCHSWSDCTDYCNKKTGGHIKDRTCVVPSNAHGVPGVCQCNTVAGEVFEKLTETVLKAMGEFGDVACAVFQKALTLGLDIGTMAIPGVGEASIGTKAAITAAKQGFKAGGKQGMINVCGKDNKFVTQVEKAMPI